MATPPQFSDPNGVQQQIQPLLPQALAGQGTVMPGMQIPNPQPQGNPNWRPAPGGGVAQGEFQTKGAHQRASMQAFGTSVTNLVGQIKQKHDEQQNKQLGQQFQIFTGAVKGVQGAQEQIQKAAQILAQDPQNAQALAMKQQATQMLQQNQAILNQQLDPNSPQGKKNIKLLSKGFGIDDKNSDTPERQAAIAALQKSNPGMAAGPAGVMSQIPTTLQMSPESQIQAQMVKAGIAPKAATGSAMVKAATDGNKLNFQYERLGLNPADGKPIPLEQLPVAQRAKIEAERAGDDLKSAQTDLTRAKQQSLQDPNSPQNKLALMRAQASMQMANARSTMAQTGRWSYLGNFYGVGPDGAPLPGASSNDGTTIGPRLAAQAATMKAKASLFGDIVGQANGLQDALDIAHKAGSGLRDPAVAAALADTNHDSSQYLQGFAKDSLSPEQRNLVIATKQMNEQAAILRSLGPKSGVSNMQMTLIQNLLPNAGSDYDYASRQMKSLQGVLTRLQPQIFQTNTDKPNVPIGGGSKAPTGGKPAPAPAAKPSSVSGATSSNPLGLNLQANGRAD